uniref:Uncharacterized protein n=1 Tax=Nelumbo nucifera TaxID=4432 RepID=A0A822XMK9_NELNU|nr:TPA_asm: hypothetical protein HUJ06_021468 [Nelumbo nucifera]
MEHKNDEVVNDFIWRFHTRILDLKHVLGEDEQVLVQLCLNSIAVEYRVLLENLKIENFIDLHTFSRRTALSPGKLKEKGETITGGLDSHSGTTTTQEGRQVQRKKRAAVPRGSSTRHTPSTRNTHPFG